MCYIMLAWYFSHTRLCIYRVQTCVLTNSHWWLGETYTTFAGANVTMGTTGDSLFPYTIKPISCNRLRKYLVFHFSWLILFMPSQNKKKCSQLQKTTNVEEKTDRSNASRINRMRSLGFIQVLWNLNIIIIILQISFAWDGKSEKSRIQITLFINSLIWALHLLNVFP